MSHINNHFKSPSPLGGRGRVEVKENHNVSGQSLIQMPDVSPCFGIIIPLLQIIHSVFYCAHNTRQKIRMREHNSWKYIHASFMGSLLCFEIL